MFADLHFHSCFSDGTYTPEEAVDRARALQLHTLALTDHDTVEGCARLAQACASAGLECLTGAELTAQWQEHELHLLAYGFDPHHLPLLEQFSKFQQVRQQRIIEMVKRLNLLGIQLHSSTVLNLAHCRSPGRPHIARALVETGVCSTLEEAFERFLKRDRPAWVPKFQISASAAIQLVHDAGGLVALAHPGLTRADPLIPQLAAHGLDALECFHSKHSPSMTERYLHLSAEYNLLVTGGSDCHGLNKGAPLMGGSKLPYSYVELLKKRLEDKNQTAAVL